MIKKALEIFDKMIVAIAQGEHKNPCFSLEKRKDLALPAAQDLKNVEIVIFTNLLVDLAKEFEIKTVIRGFRAVSDFEYELQIGYTNNALWSEFETVYLMPNLKNAFISNSIIRSIATHGGNVSSLVPKEILSFSKDSSCT